VRRETPSGGDFRASLVSLEAICALVCARGRGDAVAATVAGRQLGLISTAQLQATGLGKNAIVTRRRNGLLSPIHRGVYKFGQQPMLPGAAEFGAVLAVESANVSHRSAAWLWGVIPSRPGGPVHVTVVGNSHHSRRTVCVHRVPDLPADERTRKNGIPITTPARTLLDFASQATSDELERAIAEAYVLGLTTEEQLRTMLERHPRRSGAAALRAELDREGGPAWTRSEAERRMKHLLRQARLPAALTNQMIEGYPADFVWPDRRLIVEVDGYRFHSSRAAFERDRKRDAVHTLAGYRVIRITWRQLTDEPIAVAVIIARALAL
jgi:very-short-patch-repair endonuclease